MEQKQRNEFAHMNNNPKMLRDHCRAVYEIAQRADQETVAGQFAIFIKVLTALID